MRALLLAGPGAKASHLAALRRAGLELIDKADAPCELAVVVGGDGTVHRHLALLVERKLPTVIVPAGSGNDFAVDLGFRSVGAAVLAAQRFASGEVATRAVDLGLIEASGKREYFCCFAGVGLEATAAKYANRLPAWLKRHFGYHFGAAMAIVRDKPFAYELHSPARASKGEAWVLSLMNTLVIGGGLRLAPNALVDDGKLDCVIADAMQRRTLLRRAPMLLKGTHLSAPEVHHFLTSGVKLETDPSRAVYSDGEYICETPVEITCAPGALQVVSAG